MFSWDMLKKHQFYDIKRSKEMEKKYEEYKKQVNVTNHIFQNVLQNKPFQLAKNKFPYDVQDGIEHYVLWIHPEMKLSYKTIYEILKIYETKLGFKDFIFYENEPRKKSVLEIPHVQVFFKC
jgi:hypothetical protein